MKRVDILCCLSKENGDDELEMYINEIERKFNAITELLGDIDINHLDNITEAIGIAADMSSDLY
tara:strand:- start:239 stop:430 length:192 start_codon:yes stop_codon:yes gene_type:complete